MPSRVELGRTPIRIWAVAVLNLIGDRTHRVCGIQHGFRWACGQFPELHPRSDAVGGLFGRSLFSRPRHLQAALTGMLRESGVPSFGFR